MPQAVIFGAGNIGRGFIGQLFSEGGYDVVFVDVDRALVEALNQRHAYTIRLVSNEGQESVRVAPVRALHASQRNEISSALMDAEMAASAVGSAALQAIAPSVASGVSMRASPEKSGHLNFLLCENLKGAARTFREMVEAGLDEQERVYAQNHVGFVDTVVARMVPAPTPQMRAEDPSLIAVEPFKELPVDRDAFSGPPPDIPGIIPVSPFAFFTERKLHIHNAGHSVLAYLGYLAGYEYGYEALADDDIYFQARGAMEESARALTRRYHPATGSLLINIEDLLRRFGNRALGDTVARLARDPMRKLGRADRLVGASLSCLAEGISPTNLATGIAAGLRFTMRGDPSAGQVQDIIRTRGIAHALAEVCELGPGEPLFDMVVQRYRELTAGR